MLVAAREEILLYSREKSMAYKAAYRDLSLAGKYRELLRGEILSRFDSYRAAKFAEELAIGKKKKGLPERSLLFSAFGREGYYTLPQALSSVSSAIQITGEYEAPIIFMEILCSTLRAVGIWHEEYPSPLSVGITETVVIYRDKGAAAYTLLPAKEKLSVNRFLRPLKWYEFQM